MIDHDCRYCPTIMSGPVVRFGFGYDEGELHEVFSREKRRQWSAEISASRDGVSLQGRFPIYPTRADVDAVKDLLSHACDAAAAIGSRGDHDAAKHWVETYNSRRAKAVEHDAKAADAA